MSFFRSMLPLIAIGIGLGAFVIVAIYFSIDQSNTINAMSCNELWDSMQEQLEENGQVGPKTMSNWIVKECWS